jgi:hypothetical protein
MTYYINMKDSGKVAKIMTETGNTWTARINGTLEEILDYYMGKKFNVGLRPSDRIETVKYVEVFDANGILLGKGLRNT